MKRGIIIFILLLLPLGLAAQFGINIGPAYNIFVNYGINFTEFNNYKNGGLGFMGSLYYSINKYQIGFESGYLPIEYWNDKEAELGIYADGQPIIGFWKSQKYTIPLILVLQREFHSRNRLNFDWKIGAGINRATIKEYEELPWLVYERNESSYWASIIVGIKSSYKVNSYFNLFCSLDLSGSRILKPGFGLY